MKFIYCCSRTVHCLGGLVMKTNEVKISVYGANEICASCVGAPGSLDTYEWLQAAIGRKYVHEMITYEYIDIEQVQSVQEHQAFIERILAEDLFYPVVLVNDELVAEGVPRSEEHTSELQSRGHLVCRLLL